MKVTVQVVIDADAEAPTVVRDVFSLERGALSPDTLGLRLDESNGLLSALQEAVVDEQVTAALAALSACPHCDTPHRHKDTRGIVVRSLYGTLHLGSPRWWHCTTWYGSRKFLSVDHRNSPGVGGVVSRVQASS